MIIVVDMVGISCPGRRADRGGDVSAGTESPHWIV